jgi:hypothetical protein
VGVISAPTCTPAAKTVSCVIPVYNEAKRIAGVLSAVVGHPLIAEVIVVDDASTDDTARIVRSFADVRLLRLDRNCGKARALLAGLQEAANPVVFLLDGDLIGLRAADVTSLILPVFEGRADVAVSLRGNAPGPWKLIGLDYISGERVFAKELVEKRIDEIEKLPRFGFEVYLNSLIVEQKCRIAVVRWRRVKSPLKSAKYGLVQGFLADLRMMLDLRRCASPLALLSQIRVMLQLRVRARPL